MKFPTNSFELLDEIERLVPERLPEKGETMEDYNRYVGKRELVLQLRHARDLARRPEPQPRPKRGR